MKSNIIRYDIKQTNTHKCMKVYYTHRIKPTCFGLSCGHLQGDAFRRKDTWKYYRNFEPRHRYKILDFKIILGLKYILKINMQIKSICD